jgi:hypothetical protein
MLATIWFSLLSSRLLSRNVKVKIHKTIILPAVLYGCGTWSLTLSEEHRLRVFENRVLRRIFGPKRDAVMGEWRKLHNEELHNLYSSPHIIRQIKSRRMRWAGHVACMGEKRKVYNIFLYIFLLVLRSVYPAIHCDNLSLKIPTKRNRNNIIN